MLDLAIVGGTVIDGTGAPRRRADVGVRDGQVVAVGTLDEPAARTVDADGLVVAPGFIDPHTHFDAAVSWDPCLTPSPLHGVTTVLGGNCGFTIAPLTDDAAQYVCEMLAVVEGMPLASLRAGCDWSARSFDEFVGRLDGRLAINAGFSVGHSTVRRIVMGEAAVGEAATPSQVDEMARLVHEALSQGALGFTTSIGDAHNDASGQPVPSRHARPEEMVQLAATVREHEGTSLGITPPMGAFSEPTMDLLTSMSVAGDRCLNWNVLVVDAQDPVQLWGQLAGGDHAFGRGGSVVALTVPEVSRLRLSFANGMILNIVPGWGEVLALPFPQRRQALADPAVRTSLRASFEQWPSNPLKRRLDWPHVRIGNTYAPENAPFADRTLGDISARDGSDPLSALFDIVVADDLRTDIWPVAPGQDDETWKLRGQVWRDPRVVFGGGDAGAHLDMTQSWQYFTSLLGPHVRDKGLLTLEEGVHFLTGRPARLFGLRGRGTLAVGAHADICVFDPGRIGPTKVTMRDDLPAGASRIWCQGVGVERVYVNGVEVVRSDTLTGDLGGTVMRSGRDTVTVTPRQFPSAGPGDANAAELSARSLT
jgi:N-acyl-D-aspartate/D-glutamate deacylase